MLVCLQVPGARLWRSQLPWGPPGSLSCHCNTSSRFCFALVMLDASLLIVNKQTWMWGISKFGLLSTDLRSFSQALRDLGGGFAGCLTPFRVGGLKGKLRRTCSQFYRGQVCSICSCGVAVVYSEHWKWKHKRRHDPSQPGAQNWCF